MTDQASFPGQDNVVDMPVPKAPWHVANEQPPGPRELQREYVSMVRAAVDMLNARLLLLLALVFGASMWGFCVYEPTPMRFMAACGFSVGVVWPIAFLFLRKG